MLAFSIVDTCQFLSPYSAIVLLQIFAWFMFSSNLGNEEQTCRYQFKQGSSSALMWASHIWFAIIKALLHLFTLQYSLLFAFERNHLLTVLRILLLLCRGKVMHFYSQLFLMMGFYSMVCTNFFTLYYLAVTCKSELSCDVQYSKN